MRVLIDALIQDTHAQTPRSAHLRTYQSYAPPTPYPGIGRGLDRGQIYRGPRGWGISIVKCGS